MKTRLRRKRLLKDKMLIIKVSFILLFPSFWRCKDSRQTKQSRGATSKPKINFDVKSADAHEKDGQVVFRFEHWDLNRPDSLTETSCVCICSCSYLLTNARHLICKSSCVCSSKAIRNKMICGKAVDWTSSYLRWFGWMFFGVFGSQTEIWK